MKTKREILEHFAKGRKCDSSIKCFDCLFKDEDCQKFVLRLAKIGAMAILRQNHKKRVFDESKILTCITADKAFVGMKGYFGDNLVELKDSFKRNELYTLLEIKNEIVLCRFVNTNHSYALFYPIDEEVEE